MSDHLQVENPPTTKNVGQVAAVEGRLLSLDFFRGVTMFMLVGEATGPV